MRRSHALGSDYNAQTSWFDRFKCFDSRFPIAKLDCENDQWLHIQNRAEKFDQKVLSGDQ